MSALNCDNPEVISVVEGETSDIEKIPQEVTENKDASVLSEQIAQPKLTNPGSIDSILTSGMASTMENINDSIQSYLKKSKQRFDDIMLYIPAICADNQMAPGIFSEDLVVVKGENCIRCFVDYGMFLRIFAVRKLRLNDGYYEQKCVGFFHAVAPRNDTGVEKWPWGHLFPPTIILKRTE